MLGSCGDFTFSASRPSSGMLSIMLLAPFFLPLRPQFLSLSASHPPGFTSADKAILEISSNTVSLPLGEPALETVPFAMTDGFQDQSTLSHSQRIERGQGRTILIDKALKAHFALDVNKRVKDTWEQ